MEEAVKLEGQKRDGRHLDSRKLAYGVPVVLKAQCGRAIKR